jgi:hypothetical protein
VLLGHGQFWLVEEEHLPPKEEQQELVLTLQVVAALDLQVLHLTETEVQQLVPLAVIHILLVEAITALMELRLVLLTVLLVRLVHLE